MFTQITLALHMLLLATNTISAQECKEQNINFSTDYTQILKADYNVANVKQADGQLVLSLDQVTGGTRVSTLNTVHYGTIEAKMRVSSGSNVVSSFILMAKNGDEIDFEFVGKDDNIIQTNFFYRGDPIYDKNAKFYAVNKKLSRSFDTYRLVWTPENYEWWFNGFRLRTLSKSNTTKFPDSPSLVQFGIWKAPNSRWAGNGTDWSKGPHNITIDEFRIMCSKDTTTSTSVTSTTSSLRVSTSTVSSTTTEISKRNVTLSTTTPEITSTTTNSIASPTSTTSPKSNNAIQSTRPILLTCIIGFAITIVL